MDGSTSDCEWGEDADTPAGTGLFGYEARPKILTRGVVGNSNNSYWLSDANNPLTGYPFVLGWMRPGVRCSFWSATTSGCLSTAVPTPYLLTRRVCDQTLTTTAIRANSMLINAGCAFRFVRMILWRSRWAIPWYWRNNIQSLV